MPSAAPVPRDVLKLTARYQIGEQFPSVSWWLWDPGGLTPGLDDLENTCSEFLLNESVHIVDVMHAGVRFSDITASQAGLTAVTGYDFAAGIWDGAQNLGCTHGWHWIDGRARRSSSALTHLPGTPDAFVTDDGQLSHTGYANLRDKGRAFLDGLAQHRTPTGGLYVPVVLHRRRAGGPLPAAEPTPIVGVQPMLALSTMNRRMRKSGAIAPS